MVVPAPLVQLTRGRYGAHRFARVGLACVLRSRRRGPHNLHLEDGVAPVVGLARGRLRPRVEVVYLYDSDNVLIISSG